MKKTTAMILAAAVALIGTEASAQSWKTIYDGVSYARYDNLDIVRIDVNNIGVNIHPTVTNRPLEPANQPTRWAQENGLEIAINANFFDMLSKPNYWPLGFAIYQGRNMHRDGYGADSNYAEIGFTKGNKLKYYAQQENDMKPAGELYYGISGTPQIIADGRVVPGLASGTACTALGNCNQNYARSGICVDRHDKYLYLAVTKAGYTTTVTKFASSLAEIGCYYGINLDGAGSSGMYAGGKSYGTNVPGGYYRATPINLGFDVLNAPASHPSAPLPPQCLSECVANASSVFCDIPDGHWGLEAAKALKERKISGGCGPSLDGRPKFCGECIASRGQSAALIFRALGVKGSKPSTPSYSDVSTDMYYYEAIETLRSMGIVSPGATFRPEEVITRAEAATMIANAFIKNAADYSNAPTPSFVDVPAGQWYYPYIEALYRNGIVNGVGGSRFAPEDTMTRISFAVMLARAINAIPRDTQFNKQCTALGTSCDGEFQIQQCIAYEIKTIPCEDGEVCESGSCILKPKTECDPSTAPVCTSDVEVKSCTPEGMWTTEMCQSSEKCENGHCKAIPKECTAGTNAVCEGDTIKSCSDDGKWVYDSCSDKGKICQNGYCVTPNCTEGAKECADENNLRTCTNGSWVNSACSSPQKCSQNSCIMPQCTNEPPACDDLHTIRSCDSNGNWKLSKCTGSEKCENGICGSAECTADSDSCLNDITARVCDKDGKWAYVTCKGKQKCRDGKCIAYECSEGETGCFNSRTVQVCTSENKWDHQSCGKGKICEKGECVAEKDDAGNKPAPGTDDDKKPGADDDKKPGNDDKKPGADDDKKPGNDNKKPGKDDGGEADAESIIIEADSCSQNMMSGHHMPWFLAMLLGGLAVIRRPRRQEH